MELGEALLHFTTVWLPDGAPDLEAAQRWLDATGDEALLDPGSLGHAPHLLGLPFDMDVPTSEELLDLLNEGSEEEQWFTKLADHLGTDGRAKYLNLSRAVAKHILGDLAGQDLHADDLHAARLQNGRLVTAAMDPYETRHTWFRRIECLRHTYHPDLLTEAGIAMLRDRGHSARLEIDQ